MKISKLINMIIVLFLLVAFLPPKEVSAEWLVTGNVTLSTHTTAVRDWVITSGGVLTISPGVTVTVNCTDSDPYTLGTDPNKIEIIVEDGTLIADGVIFVGATPGTACWHGIRVLGDGDAQITNSRIEDARIGITVEGSSPTISGNTIRNIRGADQTPTSFPQTAYGIFVNSAAAGLSILNNTIEYVRGGAGCNTCDTPNGRSAYGIVVNDTTGLTIEGNTIGYIYGGNGGTGAAGVDGANGANGTVGSNAGAVGQPGTPGQNGGNGGEAYGIHVHSTLPTNATTISKNLITQLTAGNGALGGTGGKGGKGGNGYDQTGPVGGAPADGGFGGFGGAGGAGGNGGDGGAVYGISGWNVTLAANNNNINNLTPGLAARGGLGNEGGGGGKGGNGSPVGTAPQVPAGYGGDAGFGGPGGIGGHSGNAGNGYGVALLNGGSLTSFSGNFINYIAGVPGNYGYTGGAGGAGGVGGTGGAGQSTYQKGGAGGRGGNAGVSGNGGNGGNGSSVYGLYINNTAFSSITGNTFSSLTSGMGRDGGTGGPTGNKGGIGGNVGVYPDPVPVSIKGGNGGTGSHGGIGGNGGSAGFTYGIYAFGPVTDATIVNNLLANISASAGGIGGSGGNGSMGGNGGMGYTEPGGNGGNGGNAGNGGTGGMNGNGGYNAHGIYISKPGAITNTVVTITNNTIVTVKSDDSTPARGTKGTAGAGGTGGTGTPAGSTGASGSTGSNGDEGWKGYANGYYSGERITSSLYNNIVVSYESPTPANSIGLDRLTAGTFDRFMTGDVWGWYINYSGNLGATDKTGSISTNPLMLDPANGKFRLSSTSPCINTASNSAPATPGVDRDGVIRPLPEDGNVDMGAYEWGSFYRFSQASMSVNEGAGTATIIIELVGYLETAGTVSYTFVNGTAVNGTDFNHGDIHVSFPSGSIGGIREITPIIYDDSDIEGNETFQVTLHSPTGGALMSPSTITVTIIDNDMFSIFLPLIIR